MATITVIVPTYNHNDVLERAISSVLDQSFQDFEIIIVDDGSDNPIVGGIGMLDDPRITVFWQPNAGLGAARNTGLLNSSGRFIQFLDADDTISADKFLIQAKALDADTNAAVAYCRYENIASTFQPSKILSEGESAIERLLVENFLPVHSALVRRAAVAKAGNFDTNRFTQEDWALWLKIALQGGRFIFTEGPRAFYFRDHSRITSNPSLMTERHKALLTSVVTWPEFRRLPREQRRRFIAVQERTIAARSFNGGSWRAAAQHTIRAAKHAALRDIPTDLLLLLRILRRALLTHDHNNWVRLL